MAGMGSYLLNNKYRLPKIVVWVVWVLLIVVVSFTALIVFMFVRDVVSANARREHLSDFVATLFGLFAVCTIFASLALYITMCVYWIVVERSTTLVRLGWFLALLFGLHYGAVVYAFKVWSKNLVKVPSPPIPDDFPQPPLG